MGLRDDIISLAHNLEKERDQASNLWSWLPSHQEAKKYHGEYACEFMPTVSDVMTEATFFISHKLNPTDKQIEEAGEFYKCPCGENHEISVDE